MTDARRFASVYTAFWQSIAPSCELFVRRANTYGYTRWDAPLPPPSLGARRSLCAEYAFSRFTVEHNLPKGARGRASPENVHALAWDSAVRRLSPYAAQGLDLDTPFSEDEMADATLMVGRHRRFFSGGTDILVTRPVFPGCGFIDVSEGDVITGETLFEVKAVDRMVRSIDLRQLLTYAALNKGARTFSLSRIGIFNPRRGIFFEFELDDVCIGVSGSRAEVLLSEIIEAISGGDMSR